MRVSGRLASQAAILGSAATVSTILASFTNFGSSSMSATLRKSVATLKMAMSTQENPLAVIKHPLEKKHTSIHDIGKEPLIEPKKPIT